MASSIMLVQDDEKLLAGVRDQGTEGGQRGLLDNFDDPEGYYTFRVRSVPKTR
jgi:hypothetical protein